MNIIINERSFLAIFGFGNQISDYTLDKVVFPHGLTLRKRKKLENDVIKNANYYQTERNKYISIYEHLLDTSFIKKPSKEYEMMSRANGHKDLESTKAAQRLCEKRGIIWNKFIRRNRYEQKI